MSKFDIRRGSPSDNAGGIFNVAAALRGIALQSKVGLAVGAPIEFELATGTGGFIGFLTREVTVAGPVVLDSVYPGRLDLPFKLGGQVMLEKADAVEAEGADHLDLATSNKLLAADTAIGTLCSFEAGKFCKADTGQQGFYKLAAFLTPETAGNLRIKFECV